MALGQAVLVLLVLSTFWACRAVPPLEPGQQRGVQWLWGATKQGQAEPLALSRRRRDDGGQQPPASTPGHSHAASTPGHSHAATTPGHSHAATMPGHSHAATTPGHSHAATTLPSSTQTDSLEPNLTLGSVPPPAPATNASLQRGLVVPTTGGLQDETDSPEPGLLLSSVPSTDAALPWAPGVPTTTDAEDETDSPHPELTLSSAPPPPPATTASLRQGLAVPAATDPEDETDSPDPDPPLGSVPPPAPSTQAAPRRSFTTVLGLSPPSKEGAAGGDADGSSMTSPALGATTTGHKVKKSSSPAAPTPSAPWHTKAQGTAGPRPWEPGRAVGTCLLAVLLLALAAATFMVCAGVLGALLWRRARTARRQISHTEMICISSLLPDSEVPANGTGAARRPKTLLDPGSELDGDNLTLSSFLPDHS
ncbi:P-selectin glycoprotein ligand 1 [Dryobates pubescens]|uniref:P-selectin glycoprotein ligand 1 n=1 Tax=Dryobates pubescens TaxID=118200 RepID=UPI0023B8A1BC|nr:P-selectin glycoprotein ligand 1 [Dryobates pubescens]